jgi:hypothetical protein
VSTAPGTVVEAAGKVAGFITSEAESATADPSLVALVERFYASL